jgi:hypothetical protein
MNTLIVNLENDINIEQVIANISLLKGIKNVELKNDVPKTKTEELLEKMERGEYVSDDEYLHSIPGFMEALDEEDKIPLEECVSFEEIWDKI